MRRLPAIATLALLLAACSSQPPAPEQNPAGVDSRDPTAVQRDQGTVVKRDEVAAIDPDEKMLRDPKHILSKRAIHFDYDSFVVKEEYKPLIQAHAAFLAKKPKYRMLIQGNADERGSREYNLALAQKRADAVRKSLLLLGARDEQIESVSLGEEKPVCSEATEECWAKNRRGDMLYSGEF